MELQKMYFSLLPLVLHLENIISEKKQSLQRFTTEEMIPDYLAPLACL